MSKTVRILSLDGGGIRGIFSATGLKRFCQDANINPAKLYETFDIITGTSIGGIQSLGYAYGKTPDELIGFFRTKGESIFHLGSWVSDSFFKFGVMMGIRDPIPLVQDLSYPWTFYPQQPLKDALKEVFGETAKLSDLPGKVIIPSWDTTSNNTFIFSNIGGFDDLLLKPNARVMDAALATSAAPLYFPPLRFKDTITVNKQEKEIERCLIDGGVFQNNPAMLAYSVAKQLYPDSSRVCILSIGTGAGYSSFKFPNDYTLLAPSSTSSHDLDFYKEVKNEWEAVKEKIAKKYPCHSHLLSHYGGFNLYDTTNINYLLYLLDNVFIPGPGALADNMIQSFSQDLYNDLFYYRFQYQFKEADNTNDVKDAASMDDASEKHLDLLVSKANDTYGADLPKIQRFIAHFNIDRE